MPNEFMARPTEVMISYLAQSQQLSEKTVRKSMIVGRVAMAMEILTVVRLLEEHQLMAEHEGMISCLQTLLNDQDLAEVGAEWYEALNKWRKPKFKLAGGDSKGQNGGPPSEP